MGRLQPNRHIEFTTVSVLVVAAVARSCPTVHPLRPRVRAQITRCNSKRNMDLRKLLQVLLFVLGMCKSFAQEPPSPSDVDVGNVNAECLDYFNVVLEACDEEVEVISELSELEPEEAAAAFEEMGGIDLSPQCCASLEFSNNIGCNCDAGVLELVTEFGFQEQFDFLQRNSADYCNYELIGGDNCPTAGAPAPAPEEEM